MASNAGKDGPMTDGHDTDRRPASLTWRRLVRRTDDGRALDWVEVGQCAACGQGVDRAFPCEYRVLAGTVLCTECAPVVITDVTATDAAHEPPASASAAG